MITKILEPFKRWLEADKEYDQLMYDHSGVDHVPRAAKIIEKIKQAEEDIDFALSNYIKEIIKVK